MYRSVPFLLQFISFEITLPSYCQFASPTNVPENANVVHVQLSLARTAGIWQRGRALHQECGLATKHVETELIHSVESVRYYDERCLLRRAQLQSGSRLLFALQYQYSEHVRW